MPTPDGEDFAPDDIPHSVVAQVALAPYLGGFEQAEEAASAVIDLLYGDEYRRVVVSAEDLRAVVEILEAVNDQWAAFPSPEPELEARLRAALTDRQNDG